MQEKRGQLLPVTNQIDGSLAEQVAAMTIAAESMGEGGDMDLAEAQRKVSRLHHLMNIPTT